MDIYNKYANQPEEKIQRIWEKICSEILGWSSLSDEITVQHKMQVGTQNAVIPDIVISSNGKRQFIIELKKSNIKMDQRFQEQLLSYMRLFAVRIGLLIVDKIYVYILDYDDSNNLRNVFDLDFVKDNLMGSNFIEMLSKRSYDYNSLFQYLRDEIQYKEHSKEIVNIITPTFIKESVMNRLEEMNYNKRAIDIFANKYDFSFNLIEKYKDPIFIAEEKPSFDFHSGSYIDNKSKAIAQLEIKGVNIPKKNLTYAKLLEKYDWFWANPKKELISEEWHIILNDQIDKKLYYFVLPANTVSLSNVPKTKKLLYRKDRPQVLNLTIQKSNFVDKQSLFDFSPFLVRILLY